MTVIWRGYVESRRNQMSVEGACIGLKLTKLDILGALSARRPNSAVGELVHYLRSTDAARHWTATQRISRVALAFALLLPHLAWRHLCIRMHTGVLAYG